MKKNSLFYLREGIAVGLTALSMGCGGTFQAIIGSEKLEETNPKVVQNSSFNCVRIELNLTEAVPFGTYGFIIYKSFNSPADRADFPQRSELRLFENETELTLSHSSSVDILNLGLGRFVHWIDPDGTDEQLIFSSSDRTDPRSNGRIYSYCVPEVVPLSNSPLPVTTMTPVPSPTANPISSPTPTPSPSPSPMSTPTPIPTLTPTPSQIPATGPVISAVAASSITQTQARITWNLNEVGTGQVEYGIVLPYSNSSLGENSFNFSSHSQLLTNLLPGTLYHFRVRSTNQAGIESISNDFLFMTQAQPPIISAVSANLVTQTQAEIAWSLNEFATGQVEYGTTTAYGLFSVKENSFNYSGHHQQLSNLTPGTVYHFRVRSTNQAGLEAVSADYTFTTQAAPPVISNVSANFITQTRAEIAWSLNQFATGQVEYGTTTAYGLFSVRENSFNYSGHHQQLYNLTPGTLYHFRVRSTNPEGYEAISGDYTFTTLP